MTGGESAPGLLRFLSILYRYTQMYLGRNLKEQGIHTGQYPFILNVCHNPGINQDQLSCSIAIDKGTTAKAVKSLEKSGILERRSDERDRRFLRLYPTRRAAVLESAVMEYVQSWGEILWTGFSDEEKLAAYTLTVRMAENARGFLLRPGNGTGCGEAQEEAAPQDPGRGFLDRSQG